MAFSAVIRVGGGSAPWCAAERVAGEGEAEEVSSPARPSGRPSAAANKGEVSAHRAFHSSRNSVTMLSASMNAARPVVAPATRVRRAGARSVTAMAGPRIKVTFRQRSISFGDWQSAGLLICVQEAKVCLFIRSARPACTHRGAPIE